LGLEVLDQVIMYSFWYSNIWF